MDSTNSLKLYNNPGPVTPPSRFHKPLSAKYLKKCLVHLCNFSQEINKVVLQSFCGELKNLLNRFSVHNPSHQELMRALIYYEPRLKQLMQNNQLEVAWLDMLTLRNKVVEVQLNSFATRLLQKNEETEEGVICKKVDQVLSVLLPSITHFSGALLTQQKKTYCLLMTTFSRCSSIDRDDKILRRKCWKWAVRLLSCQANPLQDKPQSDSALAAMKEINPAAEWPHEPQPGTSLSHLLTILLEGESAGENKLTEEWCQFFQEQIEQLIKKAKWKSCYDLLYALCDSQKKTQSKNLEILAKQYPKPLSGREKVFFESAKKVFELACEHAAREERETLSGEELYSLAFLYLLPFSTTSSIAYMKRIPNLPEYRIKPKGSVSASGNAAEATARANMLAYWGMFLLEDCMQISDFSERLKCLGVNVEFLTSGDSHKDMVISQIALHAQQPTKRQFFNLFYDVLLLHTGYVWQDSKDSLSCLEKSLQIPPAGEELLRALFLKKLFSFFQRFVYFAEPKKVQCYLAIISFVERVAPWSKEERVRAGLQDWRQKMTNMPMGKELSIHQAAVSIAFGWFISEQLKQITHKNFHRTYFKACEFAIAGKSVDEISFPNLERLVKEFFNTPVDSIQQVIALFELFLNHWERTRFEEIQIDPVENISTYFRFILKKLEFFQPELGSVDQAASDSVTAYEESVQIPLLQEKSVKMYLEKLITKSTNAVYRLFQDDINCCLGDYLLSLTGSACENARGKRIANILTILACIKSKDGVFDEAKLNHFAECIFVLLHSQIFTVGTLRVSALELLQIDKSTRSTAAVILQPLITCLAEYAYRRKDPSQFSTLLSYLQIKKSYSLGVLKASIEALEDVVQRHAKLSKEESKKVSSPKDTTDGFLAIAQSLLSELNKRDPAVAKSLSRKLEEA